MYFGLVKNWIGFSQSALVSLWDSVVDKSNKRSWVVWEDIDWDKLEQQWVDAGNRFPHLNVAMSEALRPLRILPPARGTRSLINHRVPHARRVGHVSSTEPTTSNTSHGTLFYVLIVVGAIINFLIIMNFIYNVYV